MFMCVYVCVFMWIYVIMIHGIWRTEESTSNNTVHYHNTALSNVFNYSIIITEKYGIS